MTVREITAPSVEPITLAQAKEWCRIDSDDTSQDTTVLPMLIAAMRRYAEHLTGRAFIQRSLQLVMPGWPPLTDPCLPPQIELPFPPLGEVTSITYLDINGVEQTLATDQYTVHDWREPALVVPAYLAVWPYTRFAMDAVRVNFTAGYAPVGSPQDSVAYQATVLPTNLLLWMHARIATLYEQREQLVIDARAAMDVLPRNFADGLLDDLVVGSRLF